MRDSTDAVDPGTALAGSTEVTVRQANYGVSHHMVGPEPSLRETERASGGERAAQSCALLVGPVPAGAWSS